MYQQITLVGNLGGDPQMKWTNSGVAVTSFSVATTEYWNNSNGERQEKTVWFRVTAWRKTAENVAKYLSKGKKVMIIGRMEPARVWNDKDGQPQATLEVTANDVKFLSPSGNSYQRQDDNNPVPASAFADQDGVLEDIPF